MMNFRELIARYEVDRNHEALAHLRSLVGSFYAPRPGVSAVVAGVLQRERELLVGDIDQALERLEPSYCRN